ncbi:nuclease-related domain-containing DEAD/DEAH box helicase [Methylobacterium brachiatum]|uniref:nuclease-related domain-containing DEAD/DEAH box helicase n=1 Tax=Methylobacterium brachiatum TaxID=269660 RepID=UPI0033153FC6
MAHLVPSDPPPGTPSSERKLFEAFRELDEGWTILHSVTWQSRRNGREGDGEADFIAIHPKFGILVVEVKGGEVNVEAGEWSSIDRHGDRHRIKNPFEQATASKHALIAYLADQGIATRALSIAHAVALPDITISTSLGPAASPRIIWDRRSLVHFPEALADTCAHWEMRSSVGEIETARIVRLLAPTLSVRRRLVDELGEVHEKLLHLTEEQRHDFRMLRHLRRAMVTGGAGTGKTVLAVERAKTLVSDGFSTLLVCYNELLGRELSRELDRVTGLRVGTFHTLIMSEARRAGLRPPAHPDQTWWDESAPGLLVEAAAVNSTHFDAVVIDEGQDFPASWFTALELLTATAKDPPFYLFSDEHQQLYRLDWEPPEGMSRLDLTVNCRSTVPIASRASAVFGETPSTRGTDGPEPVFREVGRPREMALAVQRMAERLLTVEGLSPSQIVVLCDELSMADRIRSMSAGEVPFVESGKGVRVETIRRFKGLEAEAVLLAIGGSSAKAREIAYTGMTRARSALFVFGDAQVRAALSWR